MGYQRRPERHTQQSWHAELSVNVLKCHCLMRCHGALVSALNQRPSSASILLINAVIFYRAMHYSAKRGIAIACHLAVRPSVSL